MSCQGQAARQPSSQAAGCSYLATCDRRWRGCLNKWRRLECGQVRKRALLACRQRQEQIAQSTGELGLAEATQAGCWRWRGCDCGCGCIHLWLPLPSSDPQMVTWLHLEVGHLQAGWRQAMRMLLEDAPAKPCASRLALSSRIIACRASSLTNPIARNPPARRASL